MNKNKASIKREAEKIVNIYFPKKKKRKKIQKWKKTTLPLKRNVW